ncbi:ABC transporter permease [Limimaricola cinnabarinus]|uniref:ABC transporter permease n=1 Tax=Limimaricola cinnabarinus TaxID=1125964 RepID=UPI002493AA9F|nr:ABC transporter permease [Limimaricola cinnabarinus]
MREASRRAAAVYALPALAGLALLPYLNFRANRIVSGDGVMIWSPEGGAIIAALALSALALGTVWARAQAVRLACALGALAVLLWSVGQGAAALSADAPEFARVSLGGGFWIAAAFLALAAADAVARMSLGAWARIAALLLPAAVFAVALRAGLFDALSILREYDTNRDVFDAALGGHLRLVIGSLIPALAIGLPLGWACFAGPRARMVILPALNLLQTTPSIAMFGLLMLPLGALSRAVPALRDWGVGGIGAAPAIVALALYALLPIVANTYAGLAGVPETMRDAGRGMGMSRARLLARVELPLAAPVILTGIRIVVVQNIGLAAVAALIGGGGFGTLVFRGMGQAAMDLVLLGTVPIVAMAILASLLFDVGIELTRRGGAR